MKMKIEMNKNGLKRVIKEARDEYGRNGMRFMVRVWVYWGNDIECIDNDGKPYRYELTIEIHKNGQYVDGVCHKVLASDVSPWEMPNEMLYEFWDEENAMLEWLGRNYPSIVANLDRDIAHV